VYQITDAGREEFLHLLRASWQYFEREYYPLDICLFFLDSLPLNEVTRYLNTRKETLQSALEYVQDHRKEQLANPDVPPPAAAIFDHTIAHTQAEMQWVTDLLKKLESDKGS